MKDELQAGRERRLKREIEHLVADCRRDGTWPQAPMLEEQLQEDPLIEEPKPSNVGKSRLKLVDTRHPDIASNTLGMDLFSASTWFFGETTFERNEAGDVSVMSL